MVEFFSGSSKNQKEFWQDYFTGGADTCSQNVSAFLHYRLFLHQQMLHTIAHISLYLPAKRADKSILQQK